MSFFNEPQYEIPWSSADEAEEEFKSRTFPGLSPLVEMREQYFNGKQEKTDEGS